MRKSWEEVAEEILIEHGPMTSDQLRHAFKTIKGWQDIPSAKKIGHKLKNLDRFYSTEQNVRYHSRVMTVYLWNVVT